MSTSINFTPKQAAALAEEAERDNDVRDCVRLAVRVHDSDGTLHVTSRSICFGDVLEGHCLLLTSGERLTTNEYREYVQRKYTS